MNITENELHSVVGDTITLVRPTPICIMVFMLKRQIPGLLLLISTEKNRLHLYVNEKLKERLSCGDYRPTILNFQQMPLPSTECTRHLMNQ